MGEELSNFDMQAETEEERLNYEILMHRMMIKGKEKELEFRDQEVTMLEEDIICFDQTLNQQRSFLLNEEHKLATIKTSIQEKQKKILSKSLASSYVVVTHAPIVGGRNSRAKMDTVIEVHCDTMVDNCDSPIRNSSKNTYKSPISTDMTGYDDVARMSDSILRGTDIVKF